LGCALATLPVSGRGRFQRGQDRFHDSAEVAPDLAGPNPDDPEAVPLENAIAYKIVIGLHVIAVLKAVDLDCQASREAGEVEVIAAERVLPSERETAVAEPPQTRPEDDLRLAHVSAKLAGALDLGAHEWECVPYLFPLQSVSTIAVF
jgi:hypothetical protein